MSKATLPHIRQTLRTGEFYNSGFETPQTDTVNIGHILGRIASKNSGSQLEVTGNIDIDKVGGNPFYARLLYESASIFGPDAITIVPDIDGESAISFIGESGRPHSGINNQVSANKYFSVLAEHFDQPQDLAEVNRLELKSPHNIVWLVGEDSAINWHRISGMNPSDRSVLFRTATESVDYDTDFIKRVTNKGSVQLSMSVGYDGELAPQSKESMHIHVIGLRDEELKIQKHPVDSLKTKDRFLGQIMYNQAIEEISDEIEGLVSSVVKIDSSISSGVEVLKVDQADNPYGPVKIKVNLLEDTSLDEVLELTAALYTKLELLWALVIDGDEEAKKQLDKIIDTDSILERLSFIKPENPKQRFPRVPAFSIGMIYDGKTVSDLTIAPSLYGYVVPENGGELREV